MIISIFLRQARTLKSSHEQAQFLKRKLNSLIKGYESYLSYEMDEDFSEHGGGNYKKTVHRLRQHIYDLENGARVELNPNLRSVLLINLKHWNIEVKRPDDEVERLQILVHASQNLKFDPFILNMRVLI